MGLLLVLLLDKPPWWDVAWSTWALVGVGIAAAYIGLRTLADIRVQTQALINAERSWVMVKVEPVPGAGPIWDGETITREVRDVWAGNTTYAARITCKNDGKTPAWITEKHACIDIVDSVPEIPAWERTNPIQIEPEPLSVGETGRPKDEPLTCKRARGQGKTLILYGIVKYRDPFGDNRTTSFGYKVRDDGVLERLPYPKYNENA